MTCSKGVPSQQGVSILGPVLWVCSVRGVVTIYIQYVMGGVDVGIAVL